MKYMLSGLLLLMCDLMWAQNADYRWDSIATGGHTYTLAQYPAGTDFYTHELEVYLTPTVGNTALTGNIAYNISPQPFPGTIVNYWWGAGFNLNGRTIQLSGVSITQQQLNNPGRLNVMYYDSFGSYTATYIPNATAGGSIPPSSIAGGTSGQILVSSSASPSVPTWVTSSGVMTNDATGAWTAVDSSLAGAKLFHALPGSMGIWNASRILAAVVPSGDWTITSAGVSTISAQAVTLSKMANGGTPYNLISYNGSGNVASQSISTIMQNGCIGCITPAQIGFPTCNCGVATLTLDSAQITSLFSTPITIVAAIGGRSIVMTAASLQLTYGGTAFSTHTTLTLGVNSAGTIQGSNGVLAATTSGYYLMALAGSGSNTQTVQNQPLQVSVAAGNPTGGISTSSVTITVFYYTF